MLTYIYVYLTIRGFFFIQLFHLTNTCLRVLWFKQEVVIAFQHFLSIFFKYSTLIEVAIQILISINNNLFVQDTDTFIFTQFYLYFLTASTNVQNNRNIGIFYQVIGLPSHLTRLCTLFFYQVLCRFACKSDNNYGRYTD